MTEADRHAEFVPYDWMPKNDADKHENACRYSGLGRHYTGHPDDCCCPPPEQFDGGAGDGH